MDDQDIGVLSSGYLHIDPTPSSFIAGGETSIQHKVLNPSGDWQGWLPRSERQSGRFFDSMACVTFAALNSVETQLNYRLAHGLIPESIVAKAREYGYIVGDKFEFSDRFTAKMSGTTKNGNYFDAVWDSIKNHGLVPESMWPANFDTFKWDEYYAPIPSEVIEFAKRFATLFDIAYDWLWLYQYPVDKARAQHELTMCPIQISTAVCPGWRSKDPVPACRDKLIHSTLLVDVDAGRFTIEDHYNPFAKHLSPEYEIPHAKRGVVTPKSDPGLPAPVPAVPHQSGRFGRDLIFGQRGGDIVRLQDILKAEGLFPLKVISTGYYGSITATAVYQFQMKHKVASQAELAALKGRRVGPKTRDKLAQLYP